MKRTLVIMLCLAVLMCLAIPVSAESGEQNGASLAVVQPAGGAYVIVTNLAPGDLDFNFGWNNAKQFAHPAVGYWIGVYDITDSHYEWANEYSIPENLKMLKLKSLDTSTLTSGHEYYINFFVRDYYIDPDIPGDDINVAIVQVVFTAP